MDPALKQRLVGAGVLVALAVIFLPMLVQGPAPDSGVADVSLDVPDAPAGDFETRELPLVDLEAGAEGGVVDMPPREEAPAASLPQPQLDPEAQAPLQPEPARAEPVASEPASLPSDAAEMYPAATAGGNYAVSYGSYSTAAAADAAVASLRASQLPGYREAARVDGRTLQRVRIGPFASRADAEAARQRVSRAGRHQDARVIVLDGDAEVASTDKAATPNPAVPSPAAKPAAADVGFAVQLGAFARKSDADKLRDRARSLGFSAFTETVATDKGDLVRVRLGPVSTRAEAENLQAQAKAKLAMAGVVRPHP